MLRGTHLARILIVLLCISGSIVGMNVSRLYTVVFKPDFHWDTQVQFAALAEAGVGSQAFNEEGCCANPLRIWNTNQNTIKMLYGFPEDSAIGQLSSRIDADDDDLRGRVLLDGCLTLKYNADFALRWRPFEHFIIGAYLPIRRMQLSNVCFRDLTGNTQDQDLRVKDLLTNDLVANVFRLGGLCIGPWERSGLGDLTFLAEWVSDFPQAKPFLRNVRLDARLGLTLPTGLKTDEDLLFAVPFGNDGATGIIFAGGLQTFLGRYMRAGVDVELLSLFGNTRERRIKTNIDQSDLLLLEKTCVYKDWGLTQQFNLYVEFWQFLRGVTCKVDYQFTKHGDDQLSVCSNTFSTYIANTARNLEGWTAHHFIFKLGYDFGYDPSKEMRAKPYLALYAKVPVNGRQSALFTSFGALAAIDF
jgi:hypothetical protein